jgi:hypothetical protein
MSSDRAIKEIYIDTEGTQIRSYKNSTFYALSPDMSVFRGTQVIFRCHLMMADAATYFAPPAGATWLFGIDSVFTALHPDLVVSLNAQFNIEGDWDLLAPTSGYICWRADMTSTTLKENLADATNKGMYACLWMTPSGGAPTLMAQWNVTMKNIAVDPTTATAQEGITYPTTDVFSSAINEIKTPTGGLYRLQNGALQLWNATQSKWHTLSISGAAGEETLDIGPGEA